jgi:hypothetical protein
MITDAMLISEKKCWRRKEVSLWTPELYQSNLIIKHLNLLNRNSRHKIRIDQRIQHLNSLMTESTKEKLNQLQGTNTQKLRDAIKLHKIILQENHKNREKYLKQLIEDLNKRDPDKKESLKNLIHREQAKRDYGVIQQTYKKGKEMGIKHIEVRDENNPEVWRTITDPTLIKKKLIDRNILHFGQANDGPMAQGTLRELFGYKGTNSNSGMLINGTKMYQGQEQIAINQILHKLADNQKSPDIPNNITFEEFVTAFNAWNVKTTTSPSG